MMLVWGVCLGVVPFCFPCGGAWWTHFLGLAGTSALAADQADWQPLSAADTGSPVSDRFTLTGGHHKINIFTMSFLSFLHSLVLSRFFEQIVKALKFANTINCELTKESIHQRHGPSLWPHLAGLTSPFPVRLTQLAPVTTHLWQSLGGYPITQFSGEALTRLFSFSQGLSSVTDYSIVPHLLASRGIR